MYQRILIATDGSELAGKAVTYGIALAKKVNVPVCAVTVTGMWSAFDVAHEVRQGTQSPISQYEELATTAANKILDKVAQIAKSEGVPCDLVHVQDKHPAEGIIATAREKGCDLIVMASHGRRGLHRLLLGSQANEVITHCEVPALIVR